MERGIKGVRLVYSLKITKNLNNWVAEGRDYTDFIRSALYESISLISWLAMFLLVCLTKWTDVPARIFQQPSR